RGLRRTIRRLGQRPQAVRFAVGGRGAARGDHNRDPVVADAVLRRGRRCTGCHLPGPFLTCSRHAPCTSHRADWPRCRGPFRVRSRTSPERDRGVQPRECPSGRPAPPRPVDNDGGKRMSAATTAVRPMPSAARTPTGRGVELALVVVGVAVGALVYAQVGWVRDQALPPRFWLSTSIYLVLALMAHFAVRRFAP